MKRDPLFGVTEPFGTIFLSSLLALYSLYVLVTCFLLIRYRTDYVLSKRGVPLLLACSVTNILLFTMFITRHLFRYEYPCFVYLWSYNLLLPLFVVINYVLRAMLLLRDYTVNRNKLVDSRAMNIPVSASALVPLPGSGLGKPIKYYTASISGAGAGAGSGGLQSDSPQADSPVEQPSSAQAHHRRAASIASLAFSLKSVAYDEASSAAYHKPSHAVSAMPLVKKPKGALRRFFSQIYDGCAFLLSCRYLHVFYTTQYGPYILSFFAACFHFGHTLAIQLTTSSFAIFPVTVIGHCPHDKEIVPLYACIALYGLVFCPILLFKLSHVSDAYGIKRDITKAVIVGCPCYGLFVMWKHAEFMAKLREYFPHMIIMLLGLFSMHTMIVAGPVYRAIIRAHQKARRPSGMSHVSNMTALTTSPLSPLPSALPAPPVSSTMAMEAGLHGTHSTSAGSTSANYHLSANLLSLCSLTLDDVFHDQMLLAKFRKFTISEFAVENLLFYETWLTFKSEARALFSRRRDSRMSDDPDHHEPSCHAQTDQGSYEVSMEDQIALQSSILGIYTKFIKVGSCYEVNINGSTRRRIEERIIHSEYGPDVFDDAQEEVYHLLVSWSLPRFLHQLNQSMEFQ